MNIVFTTTTLPRFKGDGQSPFVLEQAIAWKSSRPEDTVYILAPADSKALPYETNSGVAIYRYHYFFPFFLEKLCYPALLPNILRNPLLIVELPFLFIVQLFVLLRFIREKNIDFIYAHWVVPQAVIAYLVHRLTKITYAVHNHSSDARVLIQIPYVGKQVIRHIVKAARKYFVTNSLLYKEAVSLFDTNEKEVAKNIIEVMPMGVTDNYKLKISNSKLKYDFGFIGRLAEKKGVHYFLDAVALLDTPVHVGIAGAGEELENLKFKITNLKLEGKVELLGHLDGDQKWNFIKSCKAMVFPSIETKGDIEGMPVSLLEALVEGRVVVASRATNVELLPEWRRLKPYIYVLEDPQNVVSYATILGQVAQMSQSQRMKIQAALSAIMKDYRWDCLIKTYIEKLVKD